MAHHKSLIGRIFGFLGSLLDFIRRAVFIVFILISAAMAWMIYSGGPPITVEDGIALVVMPVGQIVDLDETDPRARVLDEVLGEEPAVTALADLLDAIDGAAEDPRIKALFLSLDSGFWAGQAQLEELAAAITRFKASNKPVFAHAANMGQQSYFLAAHADEIVIDPLGLVFFHGFENYPLYFRDALDKLGVTVNVFRAGEFKSAVEPFIRNSMSDSARTNTQGWLGDLWQSWRDQVAATRGMSADDLQRYSDEFSILLAAQDGDTAMTAQAAGLVDHVEDLRSLRERVGELVGMDEEHGSFRQIHHARYLRAIDAEARHAVASEDQAQPAKISLVHVQGQIVDGESAPGYAGGDTVRWLLEKARMDSESKALVLRVDSPGGSVFASEQIRRAVQRYKDTGRPVVVSMGSVAASGGYWVSMNADSILAHASTITGSIGVFGVVPTFENVIEKIGISSDGVGTTKWAGALSPVRPLNQSARDSLQLVVEKDYSRFITQVAQAREMTVEQVHAVAQGQVWSGAAALGYGLVDELGDIDGALAKAAELLGASDYEIAPVQPPMDFRLQILDRFSLSPVSQLFEHSLLGPLGVKDWARRWSDSRGVYADCLCDPRLAMR